jgi:hypothetical protein
MSWYRTISLGHWAKTTQATQYKLRGLSGEATQYKVRPFYPPIVRQISFRAFDGEPRQLWGLTSNGYAVAGADLGRPLRVPRVDVGAAFAEHFVLLTDLFVDLVRPYLQAGVAVRDLPFRWDVTEQVELPWREADQSGNGQTRVVRPDAVIELAGARRRFFVECETGSHSLVPRSQNKDQATIRKLERYDDYVSGLADVRSRITHYEATYPDRWSCEVLLLVPSGPRQRSTASVVAEFRSGRNGKCVSAQALALPEAATYLARLLPPAAAVASSHRRGAAGRQPSSPFYGEPEHRALKTFVLEISAALKQANATLRAEHLPLVPEPASSAGMLALLKKAQTEMQRRRGTTRDG